MYPRQCIRLFRMAILITLFLLLAMYCGGVYYWKRRGGGMSYERKSLDLIFIGGVPRSGTTLMRAMLDAHGSVRCGEETRILPRVFNLINLNELESTEVSDTERSRYRAARISQDVLDEAFASFLVRIVTRKSDCGSAAAARFCNKDPLLLKHSDHLHRIFPRARFLLMLRDGRAVVQSLIDRQVTVTTFNLSDARQCLTRWNDLVSVLYTKCEALGKAVCLPVHYEQLVLHPRTQMQRILRFLNLKWDERVLHHERLVGSQIPISIKEKSSDQIALPVNTRPLTSWAQRFPENLKAYVAIIAPMLLKLGYDPTAFPPIYGIPDDSVKDNTIEVSRNASNWARHVRNLLRPHNMTLISAAHVKV